MRANRLLQEKSPYLQQHADNEVNWYPWGEEAFEKARAEEKPIFLSVGYSTCHWCHVMERESFMNREVGEYLNAHFVSIKVDRETRPDVDDLYLNFVQRTTGQSGWPLTVFLTPDGTPFLGGTYFPHPPRFGRAGFLQTVERVHQAWTSDRETLIQDAKSLIGELAQENELQKSDKVPGRAILQTAIGRLSEQYDDKHGGFGSSPKFPSPPTLDFLLRYAKTENDPKVEEMVMRTLRAIAEGGIRDHLEGGFHRYSTDRMWLVPHFEKMLYDQSQLVSLYSKAYAWKKDPLYREAAVSTLKYLEKRMKSPLGGFYSAEDADSVVPGSQDEHAEGAFYVWRTDELRSILTAEELQTAEQYFGVTEEGNARGDVSGELTGENVLFLAQGELPKELVPKLLEARNKRPRPARDEKILTEWNALLAVAYFDAFRYLGEPEYLSTGRGILQFIEEKMVVEGELRRSFLEGSAQVPAFAVDHAQLVGAYLTLFECTGEVKALERARHWQRVMDELFWEQGYFDTRAESELLYRRKSLFDGATLTAGSQATLNLLLFYELTGEEEYLDRYESLMKSVGSAVETSPTALSGVLASLLQWYGSHRSAILISGTEEWKNLLLRDYRPSLALLLVGTKEERNGLEEWVPFLPDWSSEPTLYLCQDFVCELPIRDLKEAKERLGP